MADDPPIKGPGADRKAKAKAKPTAREVQAERTAAMEVRVQQSIAEIAAKAGASHEYVIHKLVEIIDTPYLNEAARVSAIRELGEILGTKKLPPAQHVHLHQHLSAVDDDRLEDRIARLLTGSA